MAASRVTAPMRRLVVMLAVSLLLAGCISSAASTGSPTPSSGPSSGCGSAPVAAAGPIAILPVACLPPGNVAQLRVEIIRTLGERLWCDPDEYPIAHGTEQERAIERFPEMVGEGNTYLAVAQDLGIDTSAALTDAQKLAIYHVWKNAIAIPMDPVGDASFRFDYTAQLPGGGEIGTRTTGIIHPDRSITDRQSAPAGMPPCPICLVRGTKVDTPDGPIAVETLRLGDPIWTIDASGHRIAGTVIALGSTEAPATHHVLRLTLADGRTVTASPGHPLADGRQLGTLAIGDEVDGSAIVSLESLPYGGAETFDLVASGATGAYYADGIPLGTTLLPWTAG